MWTNKELQNIDNPPFEYDGKTYTHYEATQRMRQLERNMRKTKRELIGYDAAGLKDDFTAKSVLLRRQREQYLDFARTAGLKPQLENVGVFEYNRSTSSKSVWAINKATYNKYKDYLEPLGYRRTMDRIRAIELAGDTWLLDGFVNAVKKGDIHVLTGIDLYINTARAIESQLLGLVVDGTKLTGYVPHFIDRILGSSAHPHPGKRTGVPVKNVKQILLDPTSRKTYRTVNGHNRVTCETDLGKVTVELDTALLIQTNPQRR